MINALLDECANLHVLATLGGTELLHTGHLLAKAHAARTVNTAGHVGRNERTNVLIFDYALAVVVPRHVPTITNREVLQLTFPSLVADGAVERMVDQ